MLNNNSKSSEILASWNYHADLWRNFLEYESRIYKGSVKKAKHVFWGLLMLTLAVVILSSIIPFLVTDDWYWEMLAPAFGFGVVGLIFVVLTGIVWLYRRDRWNRINQQTGEVVISLNGVSTNNVNFDWDYLPYGVRFDKVVRKPVSIGVGKTFEILEFYTVNYANVNYGNGSDGRMRENFEFRVPIPFGKEREAEKVINRLNARLLSANDEWIKENISLGHDFSKGICRKCGDNISERMAFSHLKCRNKR